MVLGLGGVEARARRAAQRRGQPVSSAHLLLALVQGDSQTAELLGTHGVGELALLEALAHIDDESAQVVELSLERAAKLAATLEAPRVLPAHLLLALARERRSVAYQLLEQFGVGLADLRDGVLAVVHTGVMPSLSSAASHPLTPARSQKLPPGSEQSQAPRRTRPNVRRRPPGAGIDQVTLAEQTESKRGRRPVALDSRFSAIGEVAAVLEDSVEVATHDSVEVATDDAPRDPVAAKGGHTAATPATEAAATQSVDRFALDPERFPILCALGRNLTELAARGGIDPVVGRDGEIDQVLDILSRRRANNPLLVGLPGVGKTAVVEGLALRLVGDRGSGGPPGTCVVELSAGALVTGTGVRGALSERLRALREEVRQADGRVVLFLDEIHAIMAQGEGGDSVANELKTALARGELPCIGATTETEYRRVFERDAAFARRFTRVEIGEPGSEDAVAILHGIAPHYEVHHCVAYSPDALVAAVQMSVRFMSDGQLPDKAIGVIDQAAARVHRRGGRVVDAAAIAEVVAERSGVPCERMLMRDGEVLMALEQHLEQRVIGQQCAAAAIARAVRKGAVGFRGRRPLGTFLFLGRTGVGKTEMAKAVSELLFPKSELVRLDMSEFSEPHAVARLLGAPPGYVGYEEGGQLTEPVRRRGYCLVLLDEIEKAHPEVLLALLPLLDEAHITDGRGRRVDFSNTVIVMTSNLGIDTGKARRAGIGFGATRRVEESAEVADAVLAAARAALPSELWNRIDEPLYFRSLCRETVAQIARGLLDSAVATVADRHGIELSVADSAVDALIDAGGFDSELGARPMKRTVGRLIEAPLAEALLAGRVGPGDVVRIRGEESEIVIDLIGSEAAE